MNHLSTLISTNKKKIYNRRCLKKFGIMESVGLFNIEEVGLKRIMNSFIFLKRPTPTV
jgi:predicted ATP-dependent serine protease